MQRLSSAGRCSPMRSMFTPITLRLFIISNAGISTPMSHTKRKVPNGPRFVPRSEPPKITTAPPAPSSSMSLRKVAPPTALKLTSSRSRPSNVASCAPGSPASRSMGWCTPIAWSRASFRAPAVTPNTVQPWCRAMRTRNCPTPPAALCTSTRSPGRNGRAIMAIYHAVQPCVHNAAAMPSGRSSGTGISARWSVTASSAYPPKRVIAATRRPIMARSTPVPTSVIRPTTS